MSDTSQDHDLPERLSALIGRVYDASIDPAVWPSFIDELVHEIGGVAGLIYTPLDVAQPSGFVFSAGSAAGLSNNQSAARQLHNAWVEAAIRRSLLSADGSQSDELQLDPDEVLQLSVYRAFFDQARNTHLCTAELFGLTVPGVRPVSLSIFGEPAASPLGARAQRLVRLLVPHISRALGVQLRLRDAELRLAATTAALDHLAVPIVLLGQGAEVLFANRSARSLIEADGSLRLHERGGAGFLHAADPYSEHALQEAIALSLDRGSTAVPHFSKAVEVLRPGDSLPLYANFCPVPSRHRFAAGTVAIGFLYDPSQPVALDAHLLSAVYRLTRAEIRISQALCSGRPPREIAHSLGIGLSTVRTHLSRILAKTGTHRQAELVRLLHASAAAPELAPAFSPQARAGDPTPGRTLS